MHNNQVTAGLNLIFLGVGLFSKSVLTACPGSLRIQFKSVQSANTLNGCCWGMSAINTDTRADVLKILNPADIRSIVLDCYRKTFHGYRTFQVTNIHWCVPKCIPTNSCTLSQQTTLKYEPHFSPKHVKRGVKKKTCLVLPICPLFSCHARIFTYSISMLIALLSLINSNSQLTPRVRSQCRSLFYFTSLPDKCLSVIPLRLAPPSYSHKEPPKLWFSKKWTKRKLQYQNIKHLLRKGVLVLIIGTYHIFPERSLHRQMAALCCSPNVPCHNTSFFSSSISFIWGVTH